MLKLENLKRDSQVRGIVSNEIVRIISAEMVGDAAITVVYKNSAGIISEQMLFRSDESNLEIAVEGKHWAFDAPGEDFKLGLEAYRISQSSLFDPMMAVYSSNVEPLPHQISAVYEYMLPKQPLRYVLADDPGAGKTIMAGLLISELILRADAKRVLIVSPGSLTEQWQDEMFEKFGISFEIFSKEKQEQCTSGNFFDTTDLLICRLDQLSRNEDYQEKLKKTDWDLIIVDEAHKLSANYFGDKLTKTKRFYLGELLGSITRHFLLMTATPHNGKEEDFQAWLSLLDGDRFYGKYREGAHKVDITDMMCRRVKEELLKFDGKRLFPERIAYTANYSLSDMEAALYEKVTDYVRNEMNRADSLSNVKKRNNVGFALTQLQRRLASSPAAIYQSLKRRRNRLELELEETKLRARGQNVNDPFFDENIVNHRTGKSISLPDEYDDLDDELSADEYEDVADQIVDQATAARTIPELSAEIIILKELEHYAQLLVQSGNDRKWEELSKILNDTPDMYTPSGNRRKLIIFTEHKDTLNYLAGRIRDLLGRPEAVDVIHGGVNRDLRRKVQEEFRNNKELIVLIATDAAGEGVNLQNANLMVNYDLPWNPNRLEQRFGRIHRIGQTEVCHLYNIVAKETREGEVFQMLFDKLEIEKQALGGRVFDILGEAFDNISLKDLLLQAIRYGEQPETKNRLNEVIEGALNTEHLKEIMHRNALTEQHMSLADLYAVKEKMDKAEARRLQPYFIRSFFIESFKRLGGDLKTREQGRFEIKYVPPEIRERDRVIGETRTPVLKKYERVCFEKSNIRLQGKAMAELVNPRHPLMQATTDLVLSAHRSKLKQGAILVDPHDHGIEPRLLFMIDHAVRSGANIDQQIISRRLQFVEVNKNGQTMNAGWAPHLDLQPISENDFKTISNMTTEEWIDKDLELWAINYASKNMVPEHFEEVKTRRILQADKILTAVNERLIKEINHWSVQYRKLTDDVSAGKQPRIKPEMARRRVDELTARLEARKKELEAMKNVISSTPNVIGGALIIPIGLLSQAKGENTFCVDIEARSRIELIAMNVVMQIERDLGHVVKDVSSEKCGWDITAQPPVKSDGSIKPDRHIEVKGRSKGQTTITITRNEIMYALNQAEKFILAIVVVDSNDNNNPSHEGPFYVQNPFSAEPDFGVASINYDLDDLISKSVKPNDTI